MVLNKGLRLLAVRTKAAQVVEAPVESAGPPSSRLASNRVGQIGDFQFLNSF